MSKQILGKFEFEQFVNELASLRVVSENTADNLRVVSLRMLPYISDESPADNWDLEKVIERFTSDNEIPEKTALGYLSRLRSAVSKFIAHSKGNLRPKPSKAKAALRVANEVQSDDIKVFCLPIPLRSDLILTLDKLPRDLTVEEADRIATIVKSFAVKE